MAFVYMPDRNAALLFGGQGSSNAYLNDTWSWSGGCWTLLSPANSPSAMVNLAAAYDAPRSTVVLWGIHSVSDGWIAETWLWKGLDWQKSAASGPQGYATAAYDPTSAHVFVLDAWMKTWIWDGSQWQQLSPAHEPSPRYTTSVTFDPATKRLILFGGIRGGKAGLPRQVLSDTWSWNGNDWAQLSPTTSPPARGDAAMVSYAAAGKALLLGGSDDSALADAWAWDGLTWAPIDSWGTIASAGSIDTGSRVIVFGGTDGHQYTSFMRVWDGTSWATQ